MINSFVQAKMMRPLYQMPGVTSKILRFRLATLLAGIVVLVSILERPGLKPQTWGLVPGGPVMVLSALFYHGRFKASLLISVCNKIDPAKVFG